ITPDIASLFHLAAKHGVLVQSVQPGSGADRAGLKAGKTQVVVAGESYVLGGDLIVAADGARVSSLEALRDLVAAKKPGDTLRLTVYRNAKKLTISVKLGRQPSTPQ